MEFSHTALEFDADALADDFDRAYKYWSILRGTRRCPSWREMDMMALPLRLVPWFSVIDEVGNGSDFIFRFFGTSRVRLQGRDYTGRSVKTLESGQLARKVAAELVEVVERRKPMLYRTTVAKPDAGRRASYDILRLPFSDGDDVNVVLNLVDYATMSRLVYDWLGGEPPVDMMRNGKD
jgi:hypothetical protein